MQFILTALSLILSVSAFTIRRIVRRKKTSANIHDIEKNSHTFFVYTNNGPRLSRGGNSSDDQGTTHYDLPLMVQNKHPT